MAAHPVFFLASALGMRNLLEFHPQLPADLQSSTPHEAKRSHNVTDRSPDHYTPVVSASSLDDCSRNGYARKGAEAHDSIAGSVIPSVDICIAELAHAYWCQGDVGARGEPE